MDTALDNWTLAPWRVAEDPTEEERKRLYEGSFELPDGERIVATASSVVENAPLDLMELNEIVRDLYEQRDALLREVAKASGVSRRLLRQKSTIHLENGECRLDTEYIQFPDPFSWQVELTEARIDAMTQMIRDTPRTFSEMPYALCIPSRRRITGAL